MIIHKIMLALTFFGSFAYFQAQQILEIQALDEPQEVPSPQEVEQQAPGIPQVKLSEQGEVPQESIFAKASDKASELVNLINLDNLYYYLPQAIQPLIPTLALAIYAQAQKESKKSPVTGEAPSLTKLYLLMVALDQMRRQLAEHINFPDISLSLDSKRLFKKGYA
ncbi:MAG TPA: hypothetical protein VHA52_05985 [Candidatus Babeliaceae bacterium]|nr:hypothetical protein [Candidatus Babeliaceae bacterium]